MHYLNTLEYADSFPTSRPISTTLKGHIALQNHLERSGQGYISLEHAYLTVIQQEHDISGKLLTMYYSTFCRPGGACVLLEYIVDKFSDRKNLFEAIITLQIYLDVFVKTRITRRA